MRTWKLVLVAACVSAVGLSTVSAALGAAGGGVTIKFVEVDRTAQDRFVDVSGNRRPDPGDIFFSTSDLYRWAGVKRGARIGHDEVMCTLASRSAGHCMGTFYLPGGTLQAAGYVSFVSSASKVAILGGTGVYAGARGTFVSRSIGGPNSNVSSDTISLLP
jgi:hypothetical protein